MAVAADSQNPAAAPTVVVRLEAGAPEAAAPTLLDRLAAVVDQLLKSRRPRRVLDIGTGTGVLAIAAALILHRPVLASDIDARAAGVARENVRRNRARAVTVIHAAGLGGRRFRDRAPFDLVLANILLSPLQRLATPMAGLLAPGARVILSGLLTSQASAAL